MSYGSIVYGRFTHEEWERRKRQDHPFFEEGGHIYRITESHRTPSDVRYQATVVSEDERDRWLENQKAERKLKPSPDSSTPEGDERASDEAWTTPPPTRQEPREDVVVAEEFAEVQSDLERGTPAPAREFEGKSEPEPEPQRKSERSKPTLNDYARDHGWVGFGRISGKIREQYESEYGSSE